MGKHFKISSSFKWRLGENVILRLMKCLTSTVTFDIFMGNYFTSFRLLTYIGINNIQVTGVPNKNRLHKYSIIGDQQLQRKSNVATLNSAFQAKNQ